MKQGFYLSKKKVSLHKFWDQANTTDQQERRKIIADMADREREKEMEQWHVADTRSV